MGEFASVLKEGPEKRPSGRFPCVLLEGERDNPVTRRGKWIRSLEVQEIISQLFSRAFQGFVFLSLMLLAHGHTVITHISYLL